MNKTKIVDTIHRLLPACNRVWIRLFNGTEFVTHIIIPIVPIYLISSGYILAVNLSLL